MKKMFRRISLILPVVAPLIVSAPSAPAQEDPGLREMPAATTPPPVVPPLRTITAETPYYVDKGVTMAPLRAIAEFFNAKIQYSDGILTVSRLADDNLLRSITFRVGGKSAQVRHGLEMRTIALPLSVEKRLGVTFVPLRQLVENLGGELQPVMEAEGGIYIETGSLKGVLRPVARAGYRGSDAARITFSNRVGRALSIRLSGPQSLSVELGRGQTITRAVRPGVYYYKAASTGMRTRQGARRLHAGQKATWSWGHG